MGRRNTKKRVNVGPHPAPCLRRWIQGLTLFLSSHIFFLFVFRKSISDFQVFVLTG
jgi:hypothetical protein